MDGLTDLQKAAMEAFSTEGFSAASMSKIGEAAGLRASSIYSHYRGKGALFLSLIAPAFDEETRYAVSVLNGRPDLALRSRLGIQTAFDFTGRLPTMSFVSS
ncbi:MAG: helix-turn-helix domain-containing protein [Sutterella sp.]|nr:helix-turn-helix domain-containing protein [Sutterella sp.]